MTNRQSKTTAEVPSVASIVFPFVLGLIVVAMTVYIGLGAETSREQAGAWLGVALTLSLLGDGWGRLVRRGERKLRVIEAEPPRNYGRAIVERWEQGYDQSGQLEHGERRVPRRTYRPGPY